MILILSERVAFPLSMGKSSTPMEDLKNADLIVLGVATEMSVVEHPNALQEKKRVFSHGRLKVQIKRVIVPENGKVAEALEVDYGYNAGKHSASGYLHRELIYVLQRTKEDENGICTRAQAFQFWHFAYRPEDLDRIIELRSELQNGADPKSLTNNIPQLQSSPQGR